MKREDFERWFGPRAVFDLMMLIAVVVAYFIGKSPGRAEALSEVKQGPPAIVSQP